MWWQNHSNKDCEKALYSESGRFHIDNHGILQRFEPVCENLFVDEETEMGDNYSYVTQKSIRSFIVPEGVKGFVDGFMRSVRVVDRFVLPDTFERIGECCFADCILPSVVIPSSILTIGDFAFGHTHIDILQLPQTLHSPYGRQFKDSYIGTLRLPKEWKDSVTLGEHNELRLQGPWLDQDEYGYLRWYSTKIGNLEFY